MAVFTSWDYLVLALVLLIPMGIGLYYALSGDKQVTKKAYLLADSSMPAWPVAFSLMATYFSAITVLGLPQESYQFGVSFAFIGIAHAVATPLMAYWILPVFYRMRVMSIYEYFERRFGYSTRLVASLIFAVQTILLLGVGLYAPAIALVTVTGVSRIAAILTIGLVCTFYSTVGGMKAVLVTDVFQSLLMFAGICSVIGSSMLKGHGIEEIWKTAQGSGRTNWPSFSVDPTIRHSLWSLTLGGLVTSLIAYVNQIQVQRMMAVKSLPSAHRALWWNSVLYCLAVIWTIFGGLAIFNFYKDCDPVLEERITVREQLLPLYVVDTMSGYPGLPGLFVSGVFSACLSTASSALSGLSAVTVEDYIGAVCAKVFKKPLNSSSSVLAKVIVCFFGVYCMFLAMAHNETVKGVSEVSIAIVGAAGGPVLGLFFIGMFTIKANQRGGLIGLAVGAAFGCWISLGKPKPPPVVLPLSDMGCQGYNGTHVGETSSPGGGEMEYFYLYKISYLWFSVLGFLLTSVVGYICSVLLEQLNLANNNKMYLDEGRNRINFDLLAPPVSARCRRTAGADLVEPSECEATLKNSEF